MPQSPLNQQLAKAHSNVKKLCEFFVARLKWRFDGDGLAAVEELSAAATGVAVRVRAMMQAAGVEPDNPARPEIDFLEWETHDTARLRRFTAFLRDLDAWFAAQTAVPDDAGAATLREMESYLVCLTQILDRAVAKAKEPAAAAAPAVADPATVAVDPDRSGLETVVTDAGGTVTQLILDDTDERPLVQVFQGIPELTPECERLADQFLASWGIELSYYHRKKFLERLLRWITTAPDGQVLVIKMKTIEEPYEPYPSYVSRELLQRNRSPEQE